MPTHTKVRLLFLWENQGVFAPRAINADFKVEITFPKGEEFMVAQSSQSVAGYELTELKLRFKKIISQELYNAAELYEWKNNSIQMY